MNHEIPVVVFSRCLGFEHCRYNGGIIAEPLIEQLKPFVDARTVCPEVGIGLGIPREPIRLVGEEDAQRLVQPDTGSDVTQKMLEFRQSYAIENEAPDGFVLKFASPTCGPREVKLYVNEKRGAASTRTRGMFAAGMFAAYPYAVIEDEGRLKNFDIREHYLTRLFTMARFRTARAAGRARDLVAFQAQHKLILMAYSQTKMREMGRLVANSGKNPVSEQFSDYQALLHQALLRSPRRTSAINVLLHGFGYVSDALKPREKAFFLDSLEQYRNRHVPLSVPTSILRAWIIRFEIEYLADQYYFEPYPEGLVDVLDSGKGRVPK